MHVFTAPWRWAAGRLRGRADSEHEMSYNRLVFAVIIVGVLLARWNRDAPHEALIGMGVYIVLALGVLLHIVVHPATNQPRRLFALLLDCSFLSWQLHLGGEPVALFFPIYLWVIFGNGFRFGIAFLAISVPVATLCFAGVVMTTPFWLSQIHLSAGLLAGLVVLPAYAGTLIRKLSLATKVAEEASEAKSMFLASVSHELRTPLTAIIGMSGLLRGSRVDAGQREMIETIEVASRSLRTLINGLLDLSRIEAGQMPNAAEAFDLLGLLVDVRRMVESQIQAKGLRFDIHITPRTPQRLLASRQHLQEILVNLAGNAVKFTETGGLVIAVDAQPDEGSAASLTLIVEVSDTGIGIAAQDQQRIFDNFTQANSTILNRFGGTGLGLAITQRLVSLLGGTITVQSAAGAGSTFRFSIKAQAILADGSDPWPAGVPEVTLLSLSPPLIARVQTSLAAIGLAATIAEPRRFIDRQSHGPACSTVNQVLLVHDLDWPDIAPAVAAAGRLPAVLLIDESAASSLPPVATRRRCLALLNDPTDAPALRQALNAAVRLGACGGVVATTPVAALAVFATAPPVAPPVRARRVLLVDDNRVNQRVFSLILQSAGHQVVAAENGERALDILEQQASQFDIVLMDFNMPEMDGLEATKLYRVMSLGVPRLPIVGLTADASAEAEARWRAADMDGCLIKPVTPATLLSAIDTMSRPLPAEDPAGAVTVISAHPRFRATSRALDDGIIGGLRQLGDDQFIDDLLADFLSDAGGLIDILIANACLGDAPAFRNNAHALQSSAVNVGAVALGELCTPWVGQRGSELQSQSADFAARAQAELGRTRDAIMLLNPPAPVARREPAGG